MKNKKRILIYDISKLTNNSIYFIHKITDLINTIAFINCEKISNGVLPTELNIKYYDSYDKAITDNKDFDEYIVANDMFYGPFYNLKALFKKMDKYQAWSIDETFHNTKSFIVIKNNGNLENIHYAFRNTFDFDENIITNKLPFLHKIFFQKEKYNFINIKIKNVFDFIKNETDYDKNIIIDDIISFSNDRLTINLLGLNEIILTQRKYTKSNKESKIALIMYIHAENLIDYCYKYAKNIMTSADIYIVTTSKETLNKIKKTFNKLKNKITYKLQENRGRDNTALLVTCKDIFKDYDYICYVHSKESKQNKISGYLFRNHCYESLLFNKIYIQNIISKFEENPKLGLILPFPPEFEPYNTIGNEWLNNYENAKKFLRKRLSENIKLDKLNSVCAFGGMFWFRPNAFKTLLSLDLKFEDFEKEPISKHDGLLTHTIERIIPTLTLNDNYYTSYVIPDVKTISYLNSIIFSLKKERNNI